MLLLTALVLAPPSNVLDAIKADGRFADMLRMLRTTGWDHQLGHASGPYTVLAVPNGVFRRLPPEARRALLTRDGVASALASHHVLRKKYGTVSFTNGASPVGQPLTYTVTSAAELPIQTKSTNKGLFLGNARVIGELFAANGTVIVVDAFVVPTLRLERREGLQRTLPPELVRWGLARMLPPLP